MSMRPRPLVWVASSTAAGLLAMAVLSLAGQPVQAAPTSGQAGQLTPGGDEWWFRNWQVPQKVWPLSEGAGVTVAVLDTGVQASIGDLRGVVRPGLDLTGHGSRGEVDADDSEDGHGTAMSVMIAGQGYGTGTVGIAPEARILPVEFPYTPAADGDFSSAEVVEAVRFAVGHGARVINMSFGGSVSSARYCDPAEQDVFAYALEHNVVLVASAGNTGTSGTGPVEPASCAGVLAVGAVEPDGSLWPYSKQQPYVAVTAPGADMVYVGRDERYTTTGAGTSFSAVLVSAAAALVVSRYPLMPWYQVDQRLIDTAGAAGPPVPNNAFGYGMVDLAKAVNASAYLVSATGPNPVYASFKAWLATPDGRAFAARNGIASQKPRPAAAIRPVPRTAAPGVRQAGRNRPLLGRVVLIAVALAAAG
ncbi:MAG: S8 family serine peptidase, partial [Actinomycetota bacterium]|nr:S8 family serine peptidase [Actinomycetota bacterium]